MIRGDFFGSVPTVKTNISWNGIKIQAEFILDTGFSGDLQITPDIAKQLTIELGSTKPIRLASGEVLGMPSGVVEAHAEGAVEYAEANISSSHPLLGIGFLTKFGYKAIVDCKNRTVSLEKA